MPAIYVQQRSKKTIQFSAISDRNNLVRCTAFGALLHCVDTIFDKQRPHAIAVVNHPLGKKTRAAPLGQRVRYGI